MKKAILCFGLLFVVLLIKAQTSVSISAGLHGSSVTPNFLTYPDVVKKESTKKIRGEFGVTASIPIKNNLSFYTGVLYSAKGSEWTQHYDTTNQGLVSSNTVLNIKYIDIPLNLVYKIPLSEKSKFVIGAGPALSFFYNGNTHFNTISVTSTSTSPLLIYTYKETVNDDLPVGKMSGRYRIVHFSSDILGGLELGRVFLCVKYTNDLNEFYEEQGRKYKNKTFGANLSIRLGKNNTADN